MQAAPQRRGERQCFGGGPSLAQREGETSREAVAAAVGVANRPGQGRGGPRPGAAVVQHVLAAVSPAVLTTSLGSGWIAPWRTASPSSTRFPTSASSSTRRHRVEVPRRGHQHTGLARRPGAATSPVTK